MSNLTGGCLCGAVRYSLTKPILTLACHCTNCRRQSGTAYSMNVIVQQADVQIQGRLQTYADRGDSGLAVSRNFCPTCGSPIFSGLEARPGIIAIKAGTLDEPDQVKPVAQVYCDSAVVWSSLDGVDAQFPRAAPSAALYAK